MNILTKSLHLRSANPLLPFKVWKFSRYQQSHANLQNIKLKVIKASPSALKTYISKNKELRRVLSPHLSIYKPQISSMMSITLRMTGLTMGIMAWVVGLTAVLSKENVNYFVDELKKLEIDDCYWTGAKIVVVFPFAFHFVAGIRHLLFDTSKYLEKPQFYATGYAAIIASCVLAVCLGVLGDVRTKLDEMKQG